MHPGRGLLFMPSRCRRQVVVGVVAAVSWVGVLWLMAEPPSPTNILRLPFFTVLGVAIGASSLAVLPWMLAGFVRDETLLYVAGYMHREADEQAKAERPSLAVVR